MDAEPLARRHLVDTVSRHDDVFARIGELGVVPVVTLDRVDDAEPLADALLAGGLACIEITFRTDAAGDAIARLAGGRPDMLVGAGTVLTVAQAQSAVDAGARFLAAPSFDDTVVEWCIANDSAIAPGVMTPTEIDRGRRTGLDTLKFFPAESAGGVDALRAIGTVFPEVRFMPTGGIGAVNVAGYLELENVVACGGSWVAPREMITDGAFDQIERRASEAVAIVAMVRGAA